MTLRLKCPNCGHTEPAQESYLGRKVRCPSCLEVFRVENSELRTVGGPPSGEAEYPLAAHVSSSRPADEASPLRPAEAARPIPKSPRSTARPGKSADPERSRLPRWVYAALGVAGVLSLASVVVLVRALGGYGLGQGGDLAVDGPVAKAPAPPADNTLGTSAATAPKTPNLESREPSAAEVKWQASPAQSDSAIIDRGKKAAALVQVTLPDGKATGSAFCVDRSGLFITNAHVVEGVIEGKGDVRLLVDMGLTTERGIAAKVRRVDDYLDLALLKVDADPALTALELGREETLSLTAPVLTFGFPFGENLRVGRDKSLNITVISSRITALHGPKGRLEGVQYDGQINPGNSGGPVVDASGRVIGVAVATVPGAAINLAIPVGRLSEFLVAPGVSFDPPALSYYDRSKPATWSIKLEPPTVKDKLPEGLSVNVTIAHSKGDRRSREALRTGDGSFKVEVTPVPTDPATPVQAIEALIEAKRGSVVVATVHRRIELAGAPRVVATNEAVEPQIFIIRTLPRPPMFGFGPRIPGFGGLGPRIPGYGGLGPRIPGYGGPRDSIIRVVPKRAVPRRIAPAAAPSDDGLLTVNGTLDVNGQPRGAGKSIRPPDVPIGPARLGPTEEGLRELRKLDGHTDQVMDLAVSPDGERLVSGSLDGTVRVWDRLKGREIHVLRGHQGSVFALAISPDSRRALSGGSDRVLRLWDLEAGKLLRQFEEDGHWILSIAFTPDGRRSISAGGGSGSVEFGEIGNDKAIWMRDLETGEVVARWLGHTGIIDALAVSPDGRVALSSSHDQTARLWDVKTGRELKRLPGQSELGLHAIFTPDGRSAIVASAGHLIRVFEVPSGRERLVLRGHTEKVDSLAASPDGRILISGSWPERVFRAWDLRDGTLLSTTHLEGNPQLGGFTPDGRHVFWSFSDRAIREYAMPDLITEPDRTGTKDGPAPLVREFASSIEDLAVGGGGRYLCLKLKEPAVAVFDVNAADVVKTIKLTSDKALIAAGAGSLVIADPDRSTFERWKLDDWKGPAASVPSPIRGRIMALAMGSDSDGALMVVWSPSEGGGVTDRARFSFLDPKTFAVLKAGPITNGGFQGIGGVSPSGGSFTLHPFLQEQVHVRASAGGDLYGIWQTKSSPCGFQTLTIQGANLRGIYNHDAFDHLAPGPEGHTVYTGRGGVLDSLGKPIRLSKTHPGVQSRPTIPSPDREYYLSVAGLGDSRNRSPAKGIGKVRAMVHRSKDGVGVLSLIDLDEMASGANDESVIRHDFTVEKRFHLVPAANLLITVPYTNDRVILRRVEIKRR